MHAILHLDIPTAFLHPQTTHIYATNHTNHTPPPLTNEANSPLVTIFKLHFPISIPFSQPIPQTQHPYPPPKFIYYFTILLFTSVPSPFVIIPLSKMDKLYPCNFPTFEILI